MAGWGREREIAREIVVRVRAGRPRAALREARIPSTSTRAFSPEVFRAAIPFPFDRSGRESAPRSRQVTQPGSLMSSTMPSSVVVVMFCSPSG